MQSTAFSPDRRRPQYSLSRDGVQSSFYWEVVSTTFTHNIWSLQNLHIRAGIDTFRRFWFPHLLHHYSTSFIKERRSPQHLRDMESTALSFEVAPKLTRDSCNMTYWLQNMTKSVWYVLKSLVWAQPCICPLLQWQQAFCLWNLTKKRPIWFTHNFYTFEVAPKLTTDYCSITSWLQNLIKSVW